MSTERKPGSRGETARFTGGTKAASTPPPIVRDADEDDPGKKKGSTRAPAKKGFKKRRK